MFSRIRPTPTLLPRGGRKSGTAAWSYESSTMRITQVDQRCTANFSRSREIGLVYQCIQWGQICKVDRKELVRDVQPHGGGQPGISGCSGVSRGPQARARGTLRRGGEV